MLPQAANPVMIPRVAHTNLNAMYRMKIVPSFIIALVAVTAWVCMVEALEIEGFISLDCGLEPKEAISEDTWTHISYKSDLISIDTGKRGEIEDFFRIRGAERFSTLRYFPDGSRNCYDLNFPGFAREQVYLIRASFLYGNYDSKNDPPTFELYVGPNFWTSIVGAKDIWYNEELIHVLTSETLQVCLHKLESKAPFISSLELRHLSNQAYNASAGSISLKMAKRWYFPNSTNQRDWIRYPADKYDRAWLVYVNEDEAISIIGTELDISTTGNDNDLPQRVLRTAATPRNSSLPLNITVEVNSDAGKYCFRMHFAEIEDLEEGEIREFNIIINGVSWWSNVSLSHLKLKTLYTGDSYREPLNGKFEVVFQKTERSTRPPLLTAIEIYEIIELQQSETDQSDVEAMKKIKLEYKIDRISWQGDPCAPPSLKWEGLSCSNNGSPRITSLNLSSSRLAGGISPNIHKMSQLTSLDMSNNNLTGKIPTFLDAMSNLKILNLSNNKLDASIPPTLRKRIDEGSLTLLLEGNKAPEKKKKIFIIPVAGSAAAVVLLVASLAFFLILRKKKQTNTSAYKPTSDAVDSNASPQPSKSPGASIATKERRFSYSELFEITNNFERKLGKGGSGIIYLGYLNSTMPVAVKLLYQSSLQGYKEFKAEVELLLRVHHKNLVTLVGYCNEGDRLALIYEYMANGDLEVHLSGKRGSDVLSWEERLQIATQAAQGLEYLHIGCKPPIIHRDVKTKNILLDEHFQAKLGDFGLARSFPTGGETHHVSTIVAGTPGYLDPEYYITNHLSEKSDVYSFGIVLLKIITNQPVIDNNRNYRHIADWVKSIANTGNIRDIVDSNLRGDFSANTAWKVLEVALLCVEHPASNKRPAMTYILKELNECLVIERERLQETIGTDSSCKSLELSVTSTSDLFPTPK